MSDLNLPDHQPPTQEFLAGGYTAGDAAGRFRHESERRRQDRQLQLGEDTARQLNQRLRQAEREAAESAGAVVEAMTAQLAAWQDRAQAAEAELAALRGSRLYRVASPLLATNRLRRRLPELVAKASRRWG